MCVCVCEHAYVCVWMGTHICMFVLVREQPGWVGTHVCGGWRGAHVGTLVKVRGYPGECVHMYVAGRVYLYVCWWRSEDNLGCFSGTIH